jgi:Uma2 family endonuclease
MGMSLSHREWTVEAINAIPEDGNRYEVIDGELFVTPAPTWSHQRVSAKLFAAIFTYAGTLGLDAMYAPASVTFTNGTEVQPDIFVIPRLPSGLSPESFADIGRLVLAVEVLSLRTARVDRTGKLSLYQRENVPEYWIVDSSARTIERWRPESIEPEILRDSITWQPILSCDLLTIDLIALFHEALGEALGEAR